MNMFSTIIYVNERSEDGYEMGEVNEYGLINKFGPVSLDPSYAHLFTKDTLHYVMVQESHDELIVHVVQKYKVEAREFKTKWISIHETIATSALLELSNDILFSQRVLAKTKH